MERPKPFMKDRKEKLLSLFIIISSIIAITSLERNDYSHDTPTILDQDLSFNCPYLYNVSCNPDRYEFLFVNLKRQSTLKFVVNFTGIDMRNREEFMSFVLFPIDRGLDNHLSYSLKIPSDVPQVIVFTKTVSLSKDYILRIFPPQELSGTYEFSLSIVLYPQSFYSRNWWKIILFFVILAFIPPSINRYRKIKYRKYRDNKTG